MIVITNHPIDSGLPRPDFFIILIARWSGLLLQGFCIFATSFEIAGELADTPTSLGAEGINFFQRVATKLKCMNGYSLFPPPPPASLGCEMDAKVNYSRFYITQHNIALSLSLYNSPIIMYTLQCRIIVYGERFFLLASARKAI